MFTTSLKMEGSEVIYQQHADKLNPIQVEKSIWMEIPIKVGSSREEIHSMVDEWINESAKMDDQGKLIDMKM